MQPPSPNNSEQVRVLLVEDEQGHVDLIRRAFRSRAEQVVLTVAGTLREAWQRLAESKPELLITDLLLPDGRGTELLPGSAEGAVFPAVVMTGFGNEEAAAEAIKAGALDYVVKSDATLADMPHLVEQVLLRWENIAQRKRAERELARHRDHLEELVAERTAELQKANRKLQREIVERSEAERGFRESEERFRTLFETTPHGIVEVDASGNILACNRAYQRMLGYEQEELRGVNAADLAVEELRDQVRRDIAAGVAQQPEPWPYELRHVTKDGRVIDCEVTWDYKRGPQGRLEGFVCVVTDVTERKRVEKALRKEQRLLRKLLDLHERERKLAAYEIHDGLAQRLAGAMLHLQAFAQSQDSATADTKETFQAGMKLLGDGLDEARRLISGLRPPILDESGIVAAVEYLTEEHQKHGGPQIEFRHSVRFDRLAPPLEAAVFRVVQEGLANACRHSQSDRVRVGLAHQGGRVVVEVEDWGIGFDPAKAKRDRFGLQGIRERARLFGGRATIDSAPGKGTRITVELPILEKTLEETDSDRSYTTGHGRWAMADGP